MYKQEQKPARQEEQLIHLHRVHLDCRYPRSVHHRHCRSHHCSARLCQMNILLHAGRLYILPPALQVVHERFMCCFRSMMLQCCRLDRMPLFMRLIETSVWRCSLRRKCRHWYNDGWSVTIRVCSRWCHASRWLLIVGRSLKTCRLHSTLLEGT